MATRRSRAAGFAFCMNGDESATYQMKAVIQEVERMRWFVFLDSHTLYGCQRRPLLSISATFRVS